MVIDADGSIVFVNEAWEQLRGRLVTRKEHGKEGHRLEPAYATAYGAMCGGTLSKNDIQGAQSVLSETLPHYEAALTCTINGEEHSFGLKVLPLKQGGGGAVLTYQNLTEQVRREKEIYNLANLDPLTGLLNRRLFFIEAARILDLAKRHHHPFALFYLDLDGFKAVNDTNGHEAGDDVLCQVAFRLQGLLRKSDLLARLGGDEFLLLLPETDEQQSLVAVERYRKSFAQPFSVNGLAVTLNGSFGVAYYPAHGQNIEDLVRLADEAMYQAKARGGGVQVYSQLPQAVYPGTRP